MRLVESGLVRAFPENTSLMTPSGAGRAMRLAAGVVALLLAAPLAAAWPAEVRQGLAPGLRLHDGLLVAGAVNATTTSAAAFGAARVTGLFLGEGATIAQCPLNGTQPDTSCGGRGDAPNGHARLRILSGGLVLVPTEAAPASVESASGAGLLGRADLHNATPPLDVAGPALALGGRARLVSEAHGFLLRPFGREVSIEVRGDAGIKRYNGTAAVFQVTNASGLLLEAPAAFLVLENGSQVRVDAAPLPVAEAGNGLEDLFELLRAMTPPAQADRRADLTQAFGPFQLVPALLDGALAAHANLTLNGAAQPDFVLVRAPDARLVLDGDAWRGVGNASLVVQGDVLAADPGSRVEPPIVLPLILAALAVAGRVFTKRDRTPWRRRRLVALARLGGFLLLALVAAQALASLLGFHPLLDAGSLSARSRVQVGLLAGLIALVAWLMVGLSLESLARSALALRGRAAARLIPLAAGLVGAVVFLLIAGAPLTSLVARYVRL
jgi:hypothetical protein